MLIKERKKLFFFILTSILISLLLSGSIIYYIVFNNKIYPQTYVAGINLSGLTQEQAISKLEQEIKFPELTLLSNSFSLKVGPQEIDLTYDIPATVSNAFRRGRVGNPLQIIKSLFVPKNLPMVVKFSDQEMDRLLVSVSQQLNTPVIMPEAILKKQEIEINLGKNGKIVDTQELKQQILAKLSSAQSDTIAIPIKTKRVKLTQTEAQILKEKAHRLIKSKLLITYNNQNFDLDDKTLIATLLPDGFKENKLKTIVLNIVERIERPAQNAKFRFDQGRVKEFQPAKTGIVVSEESLIQKIKSGINKLILSDQKKLSITVPSKTTPPEITLDDVNNFGIKELIGEGSSLFQGSANSRIHNIALAASRLNGLLIKPGEVFSFDQALGDISVYSGYQQSYIIKDGKTVLGDGGGVCQVSTTFFRAAINAGLPIVERHAHSYRVGYYEQDSKPGFDATIYSPTVDLKIKNDTPAYILIQAIVDTKKNKLTFQFYGAKDGRRVEISTPKIWDIQPPPPPEYIEDPTLPAGTLKQIDFPAYGAKVSFNYKVIRGGQTLQDRTFYSNYKPWQARYLRGVRTN